MELRSCAFEDGGMIPMRYALKGENISPDLKIEDIPKGTKSFALIMDDPDAPSEKPSEGQAPAGTWTHWLIWNISPTDRIESGVLPLNSIQGTI
jgi:Raf kinase inhibitor-like YbhB/YbcL family protein